MHWSSPLCFFPVTGVGDGGDGGRDPPCSLWNRGPGRGGSGRGPHRPGNSVRGREGMRRGGGRAALQQLAPATQQDFGLRLVLSIRCGDRGAPRKPRRAPDSAHLVPESPEPPGSCFCSQGHEAWMTSHRRSSQQRGDPLPRGMGPAGWDQIGALGTAGGGLAAAAQPPSQSTRPAASTARVCHGPGGWESGLWRPLSTCLAEGRLTVPSRGRPSVNPPS